jgi:hypothetical protein
MRSVPWSEIPRLAAPLGVGLFLCACSSSWKVIHQASPNPFNRGTVVALQQVTFDNLKVGDKPETEWLSEQRESKQSTWPEAKAAMAQAFVDALGESAGAHLSPRGAFAMRVHFYRYDPGAYSIVGRGDPLSWPSYLLAEVYIVDASGAPVDEVRISGQGAGYMVERAEACGRDLGGHVAEYLMERFGTAD